MTKTQAQKARARAAAAQGRRNAPRVASAPQNPRRRTNVNTLAKHRPPRWYFGAENVGIGSGERPGGKRGRNIGNRDIGSQNQAIHLDRSANVIEQDESIGSVNGATSFDSNQVAINVGQSAVFPWCSQLAPLYERYKFEYCEFYYKPWVSGYSTDGQTGKVIMSCDYDSATADLQTYQQAETMNPHADGMPYDNIGLRLDPERLTPGVGLFIRTGILPVSTDIKTYDAGVVFISVKGTTGTSAIGELRVRYKVRLMNPRLPNLAPAPVTHTVAKWWDVAGTALTSNVWTQQGFDTLSHNGLGITNNAGLLTFSAGHYYISMSGYVIAAAGSPITTVGYRVMYNGVAIGWMADSSTGHVVAATNSWPYTVGFVIATSVGDTISVETTATYATSTVTSTGTISIIAV